MNQQAITQLGITKDTTQVEINNMSTRLECVAKLILNLGSSTLIRGAAFLCFLYWIFEFVLLIFC